MEEEERAVGIVVGLEERFPAVVEGRSQDPFSVLIATILSQNTNDRNSHRAFQRLREEFPITPEALAAVEPERLKPVIEVAGLANIRSRRIVEVSKAVLEQFGGDLNSILSLPLEEARKRLMSVDGIGPKTADVVLLFAGNRRVMPVDTNIFRVVDRIGLAKGRNYERTRLTLERLIQPERLLRMHLLLIRLGREICKPRRPLCPVCPINEFCDYGLKQLGKCLE
jgi:endonuclease-3